jgi:hypothetical protein
LRHLRRHRALALLATLLTLLISVPVLASPLCTCDTCAGASSCHEAPEAEPAEHACCAEEPAPKPERTAHPCECAFSSAPALPAAAYPEQAAVADSPTLLLLMAAAPALMPTLFEAADLRPTVSPPIVSPLPEGGTLTIRLCAFLR